MGGGLAPTRQQKRVTPTEGSFQYQQSQEPRSNAGFRSRSTVGFPI